jgi:endonuclease/exonuclease/phosphatase family metal-dependent hydrolase
MTAAPIPHKLCVLNLNLRFGLADDGPNSWEKRRGSLDSLLSTFACDFYAFQEANDFQIAYISNLLPDYAIVGQRRPAPEFWQNNVLFFHPRWLCINRDHFFLSATPDIPSRFPDSRWPRQCSLGLFECCDRQIVCINTHFDFDPDVQKRSAEVVIDRLDRRYASHAAILMGDFNADQNSPALKVLTSDRGGFRHAFEPPRQATFHGFSGNGLGEPIDWILYRSGVRLRTARVITESYKGRFPSDHFALYAEFTLS